MSGRKYRKIEKNEKVPAGQSDGEADMERGLHTDYAQIFDTVLYNMNLSYDFFKFIDICIEDDKTIVLYWAIGKASSHLKYSSFR